MVDAPAKSPDLSLYGLERELLELLQLRDDVAGETHVTEPGRSEQTSALEVLDQQITEYIKRQTIARADSVIASIREYESRAEALDQEIARLKALRNRARDRVELIRTVAAESLAATLDQQDIITASQGTVLARVRGRLGQVKLCKSPPSVEVTDESLLPLDYLVTVVTLTGPEWLRLRQYVGELGDVELAKKLESCETRENKPAIACDLKQSKPVAGARLVEDSVHLRT